MSDVNNNTEQEHQQQDESYSSVENDSFAPLKNVIPIDKLKNGWFALSSMMIQGSARVQEKIIETYNSEQVQNFKQKVFNFIFEIEFRFISTVYILFLRQLKQLVLYGKKLVMLQSLYGNEPEMQLLLYGNKLN